MTVARTDAGISPMPADAPPCAPERIVRLASDLSFLAGGPIDLTGDGTQVAVTAWTDRVPEEARDAVLRILGDALRSEDELHSLSAEILERYEEASLVFRLSERLGSVVEEEAIAGLVLEDVVRVLGADQGELWLHRGPVVELAAAVPAAAGVVRAERDGAFTALYENRPWLREAAADRPCEIAVPLPSPQGHPLGVLVFRGRHDGRGYGSVETKLLTTIAALTSAFVRNGRLASEARVADAKRREDEIARQVHAGLLPHEDPTIAGLDVAAVCRAADTVGGDYYGFLDLADGAPGVVLADISGHGVGAALYMAAAKGAMQAEAGRSVSPSDILRRLNEALSGDFSRSDVFATAMLVRFDLDVETLEYTNAGHPPPMLIRRDGTVERLERGGLALGVLGTVLYQEETRRFCDGDTLVLYTDGLTEARNADGEFFGAERLELCVSRHAGADAATLRDALLFELDLFRDGVAARDDVTVVVVGHRREDRS
jgi:hypothetical protein